MQHFVERCNKELEQELSQQREELSQRPLADRITTAIKLRLTPLLPLAGSEKTKCISNRVSPGEVG